MTRQRSFKRLVRTRMEKTGESYTAARASLLAGTKSSEGAPVLMTSDESIRERTGRGWEEWFEALDEWGAASRSHRETARWVAAELGIQPLAWNAQAITHSYELTRGLRAPGEHADGFSVSVSRTVAVPVERLYDAFLASTGMAVRTATRPRSARLDSGSSRVAVTFAAKDGGKSVLALQHSRLADAAEADRVKASWRERLDGLKQELEHA
jgi:hypothetical protein